MPAILRHKIVDRFKDLHFIQQLLGHGSITTTIYTHITPKGGQAVSNPLDGWLPAQRSNLNKKWYVYGDIYKLANIKKWTE